MRTSLPLPSPVKFLQERGGVEGIIKGAIGELKQNVQSLQAGSPPRQDMGGRGQTVNTVSPSTSQITSRIDFLEARNKNLAKMLEDSLKGLWEHQRLVAEDKTKVDVDALSLAIAKVQFVQVYLEDSTMPIPMSAKPSQPSTHFGTAEEHVQSNNLVTSATTDDRLATGVASKSPISPKPTSIVVISNDGKQSEVNSSDPARGVSSKATPDPSPFQQPRPSLAQSSFSWMLGEDQRPSSFVAASPLSPETRRRSHARGKVGFLFGDDKTSHAEDPEVKRSESSDLEGFTLGTLRGVKDKS